MTMPRSKETTMKFFSMLAVLCLTALASQSVLAGGGHYHGGHYHGGHSSVHFGVWLGVPLFGPWWYPPAPAYYYPPPPVYYGPPVIYRQPVVVSTPAPTVADPLPNHSSAANSGGNGVVELGPAPGASAQTPPPPPQSQANAAPPPNHAPPQTMTSQVYVYPRQGQSTQKQALDEADCNRWASTQMGKGFSADQAAVNFQRALAACLDAHGYSVR
jgi:hypothetical protein